MSKRVCVVVLNWNGREDVLECLESLEAIDYDDYWILMADNGSEDGSVEAVREKHPEVEILELGRNLGFAGGNNAGMRRAFAEGADYVHLINNDTAVEPDYLKELVAALEADPQAGTAGSKIMYHSEPERIWFAGGKINWLRNKGEHIGLDQIDEGQHDRLGEVGYLTGCSLLIKREVLEKVGFLAEDYFLYYEDADYSLRVKRAGYRNLYVPTSKIYHKVSRSTKAGSPSYIYYHVRNGLVNARRNGNLSVKVAIYGYAVWLFSKQLIKLAFFPKKREWAKAVLRGEKDFLLKRMGKVTNN